MSIFRKSLFFIFIVVLIISSSGCSLQVDELLGGVGRDTRETGQTDPGDKPQESREDTTGDDASGLMLYPAYLEISEENTVPLYAYLGSGEDTPSLAWESSDESVAEVDKDGEVTAKADGETTIEVSSKKNPDMKAVCVVRVYKEEWPTLLYREVPEKEPQDTDTTGSVTGGGPDGDDSGKDQTGNLNSNAFVNDNTPIKYDKNLKVEKIPTIDQFNWNIKILSTDAWEPVEGFSVFLELHVIGSKSGGKTLHGNYNCKGSTKQVDVAHEYGEGIISENWNLTFIFNPFIATVEEIKVNPTHGLAEGKLYCKLDSNIGVDYINPDGEAGHYQGNKASIAEFPYTMVISPDGYVIFKFITRAKTDNEWIFEGRLYKEPIIPD